MISAMIAPLLLAGLPLAAATSQIERVVVFADRAEVTRVDDVSCGAAGAGASVLFEGLPDAIDARTLRGEAEGTAVAVGVSLARTELSEALDERVRTLRNEVLALDDQLAAIARAEVDDAERARTTQSYGSYFRSLAVEEMRQAKPSTSRWDQLLDFLQSNGNAAAERRVARAAQARTLSRQRERLAARLALLNPAASPSSLQGTVAVRCGARGKVRVRLSYVVPGATWSPEYDLRFAHKGGGKSGPGRATLTVAGVVSQSSGEDWSDVELWLSTAKPRLGGEAPLPNPIYVHGRPDETEKKLVQAQEQRAEDLKAGAGSGGAVQGATLDDGGKAFVLKLPRKVTVRADGRPYWFPVDDVATKALASLVAVPALSPYVFQVARLNNPAPYPLLAGRVHVFRGATYVGDEQLEYRAPGEPMEVSLGIDEEIELDRKELMNQRREPTLFSGKQGIAQGTRTLLRNRSDGDVVVEVREQIPVSKQEDIVVVIDAEKTAPGYQLDKKRGHLKWSVAVKKGATEQRDLAFTIRLPKEWAVQ